MKSWIIFFLGSLGVTNLLIWIDRGIAVQINSIIYLNILLFISFLAFFIWRYKREMKYTASLAKLIEDMEEDWLETLPSPNLFRDEMTYEVLQAANNYFKHKLSEINEAHVVERDYISSWVHEVKAPLTAMKLVLDDNRNNPVHRKMESEWFRIHMLIDQQLYISRIPTLESDYVLETTSLQQLAAQEVREMASWCMEKDVAVEIDGEDREVVTDRKWCRFIIRQILTNAVKYSPDGGMIVVATSATTSGNIVMTIKDEGPGIPPHDLPRIFDKGFTGGTGRIQNAATGLGLYLAQTVASKIGIVLTAQSEVKQGTIMQMTFTSKNTYDSIRT